MTMSMVDVKRKSAALHQVPYAVTIAINTAVSSEIEIGDLVMRGLAVLNVGPAWTPADIGLEVSMNGGTGGTWTPVRDETATRVRVTSVITTAGSVRQLYTMPAAAWGCMRYRFIRLVSLNTSTGANVNQGGPRTLEVSILA